MGRRPQQVADLLQAELAVVMQRSLRDPRVGFVTITGVSVSPDLKNARVHISVLGEPERQDEAVEALTRAAGFLRRELAPRLRLKQVPQLTFRGDASLARGARIEEILSEVLPREPEPDPDTPSGDEE